MKERYWRDLENGDLQSIHVGTSVLWFVFLCVVCIALGAVLMTLWQSDKLATAVSPQTRTAEKASSQDYEAWQGGGQQWQDGTARLLCHHNNGIGLDNAAQFVVYDNGLSATAYSDYRGCGLVAAGVGFSVQVRPSGEWLRIEPGTQPVCVSVMGIVAASPDCPPAIGYTQWRNQ